MKEALSPNIEDQSNVLCHALPASQVYFFFHLFFSLVVVVLLVWPSFASAQVLLQNGANMESQHKQVMPPRTLSEQLGDLSHQVSELQAKVREQGLDAVAMKANGDELRLKMSMGTMGGVPQAPPPQPIIPAGNNQGPDASMMAGMMSMMNSMMGGMGAGAPMGQAVNMGPSSFYSELPGFPGVSHLYHIGSTNFFLDHPQHITLSLEQQSRLGEIRMKSLLKRSDFNRKIQEAEEQVWLLTASDQPNFVNIEAKVRESEKLQGDFRLAFIKDVGEAAMLLSNEQRNALLGQISSAVQALPVTPPASQNMGGM
ncbi:MAG TPA: hypothetical protein PKA63_12705 [Oligoflexia bacterium]|nr:hypothetical protein [Oligoflexia bacterium]HMP49518.1 hypothetical protein [Oligoflexia bacterium]